MDELVDKMITYAKKLATHDIGRGLWISDEQKYRNKDKGPYWVGEGDPSIKKIIKEGTNCVGLLALLLRHVGIPLPFKGLKPDLGKGDFRLQWGFGGGDEWMYLYKDYLIPFKNDGKYPKGTMLWRVYNPLDMGHGSMLMESSEKKPLLECKVIQSAGEPLGCGKVTAGTELVGEQVSYYAPWTPPWDIDKKFTCTGNKPYYQFVLLPKYYLNQVLELNMPSAAKNKEILEKTNKKRKREPPVETTQTASVKSKRTILYGAITSLSAEHAHDMLHELRKRSKK